MSARSLWLLVPGILYLLSLNAYYVGFFNDDAFFLIGAKSLISGSYSELNHPGHPPFIQYLPGYPLLLAPWMIFAGKNFLGPQLFSVLMTLGSVFLFYRFVREELPPISAAAATALLALNPLTVSMSGVILSDIPALLWTVIMLTTARAWWDRDDDKTWTLLGLMAAFGFLLRPTGAAFVLALPLALVSERRLRPALIALTAGTLPILAWLTRNYALRGHGLVVAGELADPYKKITADVFVGIFSNAWFYTRELFGRVLFRQPLPMFSAALGACLCGIGILRVSTGGWRRFALAYSSAYAIVILLWPKQTTRYLLPLLPFILWWLFAGAVRLEKYLKKPGILSGILLAAGLTCAALPVSNIVRTSLTLKTPLNTPPRGLLSWIETNTKATDVFAAELDGRLYLLTGRYCRQLPRWRDIRKLGAWAKQHQVNYVLTTSNRFLMRTHKGAGAHDPVDYQRLDHHLPDAFSLAYSDKNAQLYRILP
ncbi:MAG: hypothetical protein COB53_03390 [Elusimicrobia bacterium]|nr:MAG: hypothetical protein COB53_03390 [Elusimicrobiota bacterium]